MEDFCPSREMSFFRIGLHHIKDRDALVAEKGDAIHIADAAVELEPLRPGVPDEQGVGEMS